MNNKQLITVQAIIDAPVTTVWKAWITPEAITQWNTASDDWHTTQAENNLAIGEKFNYRMEAKDGSFGFDFWGIYNSINLNKQLSNTLGDGRKLNVIFNKLTENRTEIIEQFEAENENEIELQRNGWQAILDNFKKYVETNV